MRHSVLIALGLLAARVAMGQTRGEKAEFDVASIRESRNTSVVENRIPSLNVEAGRNLAFANTQLQDLIMLAYRVGAPQISGPDWLTNRYDIIAKVPENATKEQIPLMLRALLEDRFKLAFHRDQKTIQIYALEIAKGGMKMRETPEDDQALPGCIRSFAATSQPVVLAAICHKLRALDIAQQVQSLAPGYFLVGPVVDLTGLKALYDFNLKWMPAFVRDGLTIFDAIQEQLGLKLERRKQPMEIFVIDHCEKTPTEN